MVGYESRIEKQEQAVCKRCEYMALHIRKVGEKKKERDVRSRYKGNMRYRIE